MSKIVKLHELIEIKNGKDYKYLETGDVPVYGSGGLMTYVNNFLYEGESILLPRKGTLDNIMYVNQKFWTVDTMYWSIIDASKVYPKYLFCYLSLLDLSSKNSGSTLPSMTFDSYYDIPIKIIDYKLQKRIGDFYFKLTNKIELNNKINAELEAIAKTLYDYWFLQFEFPNEEGKPYKSSGGKMVWNEELKREIPEGWEVVQFRDLCNVKRGASPRPIDAYMDKSCKGMPWIKISDATSSESPFMTQIKEYIIPEGVSKSVHIKPNTLIVSNSATPGIPKFVQLDACVHDGWLVLDDYVEYLRYYLFYVIKMVRNNLLNVASGSIFKNLKTDYLKEYACLKPQEEMLKKFHKQIAPLMEKILETQKENQELIALRDFLLPLLMNGQVGFKE